MKLQHIIALVLILIGQSAFTQTPKKVIVEHFTNTRCGICASSSKNPAFYTNLENHPGALHISYHPSSPYSNCLFSQHNPAENDGRANYYNTFGSTPDLVVQGVLKPTSIAFSSPDVFAQYLNQISEVAIEILQTKTTDETIEATITITTMEAHNYIGTELLVGVAEKLVEYAAPNGEQEHHDVFRKALTAIEGDAVTLPAIGESISFTYTVGNNADWDFDQMFVYAILNDSENREVIQSEAALPTDNMTALEDFEVLTDLQVFPNPASDVLNISLQTTGLSSVVLFDISGAILIRQQFQSKTRVDLSSLASGIYHVKIESEEGSAIRKVVVVD